MKKMLQLSNPLDNLNPRKTQKPTKLLVDSTFHLSKQQIGERKFEQKASVGLNDKLQVLFLS